MSVPGTGDLIVRLTPILGIVLASFLVVGLALPVLPLHVHAGLGLGAFVVGIVAGSQFAASLVSRIWSGGHADKRGPRHAVTAGLVAAAASGGVYLASLALLPWPALSVAVLIAGRAVLGAAESFIITGALSWALSLAGPAHAGKTMAWVGTAMYAAFAGGAPLGTLLYERYGFAAIGTATVLLPLAALALVALPAAVPTEPGQRSALGPTIRAIWAPGVGLAFSSIGFGAITAFAALLFVTRGWSPVWLPMTGFACAFMLPRIFLGHLPDRLGGARVALLSVTVEAAGLAIIWAAPGAGIALIGAVLTGLGYSLVYPGFGVEVIRRTSPEGRGLAMGTYTAFLDLALGLASPALGFLATVFGIGAVFLAGSILVLGAAIVAMVFSAKDA